MSYRFFDKFAFRTPLYSYERGGWASKISEDIFNEAIFLASTDFFNELKRKVFIEDDVKIERSVYKYITRAITRPTPFGLFAGCSMGNFNGNNNRIIIVGNDLCKRIVRLDMNYLCALIRNLESRPEIRNKLKHYPNDSIYYLGGRLRYIEYKYAESQRIHGISSVEPEEYLKMVLEFVSDGKYIDEIIDFIVNHEDVNKSEAKEYVDELIQAQLLKSELEACVSGNDILEELINNLKSNNDAIVIVSQLIEIKSLLNSISDSSFKDSLDIYHSIINIIKKIGVPFDPKYLFQCDMYRPTVENSLPSNIKDELLSLVNFLCQITPLRSKIDNLNDFRDLFYEQYEESEMPLLEVLDSEIGIGFGQNQADDESSNLLQGIGGIYKNTSQKQKGEMKSSLEMVLFKKYIEYVRNGADRIILTDSDFVGKDHYYHDLPPTISIMCSIVGNKYYIKSCGGSCAANILGRFGHLDSSIENFCKEIAAMDQYLNPNVILAEIVHLPESRSGNILFRPILRDYEIHYLAKAAVNKEYRIPLSDLMVSVKNNKIFLRSKRLNKIIVPRLTTAHNYHYNALPVYKFLCELQTQNIRDSLYFSWGKGFLSDFEHIPRVEYNNFILSRAKWLITKQLFPILDIDIEQYLKDRNIPECIIIAEGDNEQYIDFKDKHGIDLFRSMLEKRKSMIVEEFLFDLGDSPVQDTYGRQYCNEFIFACYKTNQK